MLCWEGVRVPRACAFFGVAVCGFWWRVFVGKVVTEAAVLLTFKAPETDDTWACGDFILTVLWMCVCVRVCACACVCVSEKAHLKTSWFFFPLFYCWSPGWTQLTLQREIGTSKWGIKTIGKNYRLLSVGHGLSAGWSQKATPESPNITWHNELTAM